MPCNLNFNQCNSFRNFPQPIFNCYCRLIALLNSSTTTVINPTINSSNAFFTATAQTISSAGNLVVSLSSTTGNIQTDGSGNIILPKGKYLITANINGIFPTNGEASFSLYKDGSQIASSVSEISGNSGDNFTMTVSSVVNVTGNSSTISVRNINGQSQTINNGSIVVQALN